VQINNIQDEIVNVDNRIDEVNTSLKNTNKELNTNLENLNKSLKTIIAGHAVGEYDKNLFGIMITVCGVLIQLFYSLRA
jgi:lipid II:glycine glycyltransferase (peptidoglycan interpeptide bridge formation enzyme)